MPKYMMADRRASKFTDIAKEGAWSMPIDQVYDRWIEPHSRQLDNVYGPDLDHYDNMT